MGGSEVFMYLGLLEFFNGQAPDGFKSFGSSLSSASRALGRYANSLLVNLVMDITARGENLGWIPQDLNAGHMERFYFLIAGLTTFDCVIYYFCAKRYKPNINLDEEDHDHDHDDQRQNQKPQDHDDVNDTDVIERV